MYRLEDRISFWNNFKENLNFIFLNKFEIKNIHKKGKFLILPFPFEENILDIIKNFYYGEIITEVLNLFYFIKRDFEFYNNKVIKYELNPIDQTVKIKFFDFDLNERYEIEEKTFTPIGVVEFLKFRGFRVKEVSGDKVGSKIKESSRYIVLRFERL